LKPSSSAIRIESVDSLTPALLASIVPEVDIPVRNEGQHLRSREFVSNCSPSFLVSLECLSNMGWLVMLFDRPQRQRLIRRVLNSLMVKRFLGLCRLVIPRHSCSTRQAFSWSSTRRRLALLVGAASSAFHPSAAQ
jgi:hypothetical protein